MMTRPISAFRTDWNRDREDSSKKNTMRITTARKEIMTQRMQTTAMTSKWRRLTKRKCFSAKRTTRQKCKPEGKSEKSSKGKTRRTLEGY